MNKSTRILLVEDDENLAKLTASYLTKNGYEVDIESDGDNVIERVLSEQPDFLILDVMLPGKGGIDICRELRSEYHGPILMLTALTEQVDQIVGLEMGADDYICKPIEPRLLLARIKALLRMANRETLPINVQQQDENYLIFDDIEIDNKGRRLYLSGKEVALTMPEYEVMWLLAKHAGTILSRSMMFKEIRGFEYDGINRFVDLTVSHLRMKLGEDSEYANRIKTIRGQGYLFIPTR
ncbi:MAG: response regulator [Pseudomonadales bacterium]|nr:response regulator [Pseudomonadales bacterium]